MLRFLKFNTVLKTLNFFKSIDSFVQVGAHDGEMHDPLRHFILANKWHGILIEPQQEMIKKVQHNYRYIDNLTYINAAVYNKRKKIILYKVNKAEDYSHTGWASINPNRFEKTIYEKDYIEETVQGMPLMDIIRDNNFKKVDLLQIDTEGYDADVIDMFDFEFYYPILIQYEHIHLSEEKQIATKERISKYGYHLIEKKNDTFAIRRDKLSMQFYLIYILLRIYQALSSRLQNIYLKLS